MNGTIGSSWKVGSLMMQSALLTESEHMGGGGVEQQNIVTFGTQG